MHAHFMITYRTPDLNDAEALAELSRTTFVDTFGYLYQPEDLNAFLVAAYGLTAIEDELKNSKRLYHVAQQENRLIGYCKLGFENSLGFDLKGARGIELKQLYIRNDFLGGGVAQTLMDWALAEARARDAEMVILSVWSGNERAQRFYKKYGFEHVADTYFMVGNHRDEEFLYGLRLAA